MCSGALIWLSSLAWDTVKLTLKVGFICPFVVDDPTDLGATIVVAQALCLSIFNLSPTQKTCLFTDGNKANVSGTGLEPHRCQLSEEPTARVLRDALRAADCGSRTHTAKRPTPGCGRVPPAPARLPAPSNGLVAQPPCGSLAHLTAVRLKRLGGEAAHQQEPPSPLADSDPKLGLADSEPRVAMTRTD